MIQEDEKGLRGTWDKAQKAQDKEFELMQGLHTESQTSGQGKSFINVEVMKNNFSTHLGNMSGMISSSQNKVTKLQILGGCVHVVAEKVTSQLNKVKEITLDHSRWLMKFTHVRVPSHEELIPIIVAAKAYRAKTEKGKKSK